MSAELHVLHSSVWSVIDDLAASNGMSRSGLAIAIGHDKTSFNPSKRCRRDGGLRFPSTETLGLVAARTSISFEEIGRRIDAKAKAVFR